MTNSYLIHDMIRICPQTGRVLEDQAGIMTLGGLKEASSHLVSPRNAYVSFQIIVPVESAVTKNTQFKAETLKGDSGDMAGAEFVYYAQWYHRIKERYYPDALVPLAESGPHVISLADVIRRNDVPGQTFAAVWVDLFIPADTRPGLYHGAIHVTAGGETEPHDIRVTVLETAVPDESLIMADLNSYADNISRRMEYLRGNEERYEDGTYFTVERQFFKMAHEHRALLHYLPYQHSGRIPPSFIPELEGKGKEIRVKDWSRFDEHFGPYLDGSAFADTRRGAIPLPYMYLPMNFHWPADYVKFGTKGYRTEFTTIMEEFYRHFTEKGWTRTKFELFLNHKKRYKLFPYDGDETRFLWDEKINDIFYDLSKSVFEKDNGAQFIFRTDSSWAYGLHFAKYADKIKLWVVNQQIFSWFPESLEVMRQAGNEVWTYGSAEKIGTSLLGTVISPLAAVARGVDGFVYWENTLWGDDWHLTPEADGSSAVFYPGDQLFGILGPIPTIRLKTLRSAMQLADCLEGWVRKQPEGGRERIGRVIADTLGIPYGSWWPGKPDFLGKPPYEWWDGVFSDAPRATLHQNQPPETFNDLKQKVWEILG